MPAGMNRQLLNPVWRQAGPENCLEPVLDGSDAERLAALSFPEVAYERAVPICPLSLSESLPGGYF